MTNDPTEAAAFGVEWAARLTDGRIVYVTPLTIGRGRIVIGDDWAIHNGW